jgi:hypothetical protein
MCLSETSFSLRWFLNSNYRWTKVMYLYLNLLLSGEYTTLKMAWAYFDAVHSLKPFNSPKVGD